MKKLSEGELDFLRELSNIGVGHAATALSQLIGRQVGMRVPKVTIVDLSSVPELMGGSERIVSGVYLQVLGDARGGILLIFPDESSKALLKLLLKGEEDPLSEMGMSTLKEVGNILASSFLSGLADLLGKRLVPTPPELYVEDFPGLMQQVMADFEGKGSEILMVEALFEDPGQRFEGRFYVLPEAASLTALLQAAPGSGR